MNIADVRKRAFAMPLTSPAFPPGPYRFINREYLIITYGTDRAALEAVVPVAMDVANETQVNAGVEKAVATFGRLDMQVSNAGIQIVHPIEDFPYADWKKIIAIHLGGAFLTTKASVKHMYRQGSGALIYMGSVHSHEASPLKAAYVAAKPREGIARNQKENHHEEDCTAYGRCRSVRDERRRSRDDRSGRERIRSF